MFYVFICVKTVTHWKIFFPSFFCWADIFDRRSFSFSFFKFCRRFASSLFLVFFFYINLSFSVNFAILIKDQLLQSGLVRES